jgi:hypothetical protein
MDVIEDQKYWNKMYQRELSEAELLEIRANLVRFVSLLTAQKRMVDKIAAGAKPQ